MPNYKSAKSRDKRSRVQKFKDNFEIQERENDLPNFGQSEIRNECDNSQIAFLAIVFRVSGNQRRDIDGMVSTVLDSLVHANIIQDDDLGTIPSIFTTWLPCEKGEEGFDLVIGEI
ncbi:hypothetical protein [Leptospira sp. GIMC2001]|uniref:hypothetical protein n=1 Tax=Leptospira sp. GIMC2001 TaxID=1513297 RepID=UPI0023492C86|nr:hypothetical protein [Leptospira sp. GIMC2001]WCL51449.1 hypothetical protein O4O04_20245 [Leptospira sp. GIMC2001]